MGEDLLDLIRRTLDYIKKNESQARGEDRNLQTNPLRQQFSRPARRHHVIHAHAPEPEDLDQPGHTRSAPLRRDDDGVTPPRHG